VAAMAAATAARHVNPQVAEVSTGSRHAWPFVRKYANTRTRTQSSLSDLRRRDASCGTEAADQARGKPSFGTGIRHFLNRKSGVSLRTRVRTPWTTDLSVCGTRRNSKDRSDKVALYRLLARVTPLIIIAGLLFFSISRLPLARSLTRVYDFLCLYELTHARTSAPVLIARAAVSRQCQCTYIYICTRWTEKKFRCVRRGLPLLTMTAVTFLVLYFLRLSCVSWNMLLSVTFGNYETSFDLNIAWVHPCFCRSILPFIILSKTFRVNCHSEEWNLTLKDWKLSHPKNLEKYIFHTVLQNFIKYF